MAQRGCSARTRAARRARVEQLLHEVGLVAQHGHGRAVRLDGLEALWRLHLALQDEAPNLCGRAPTDARWFSSTHIRLHSRVRRNARPRRVMHSVCLSECCKHLTLSPNHALLTSDTTPQACAKGGSACKAGAGTAGRPGRAARLAELRLHLVQQRGGRHVVAAHQLHLRPPRAPPLSPASPYCLLERACGSSHEAGAAQPRAGEERSSALSFPRRPAGRQPSRPQQC
jgi:hypothetical protein